MNDAFIKTQAVAGERLVRLVRSGVIACVLAGTALGAMAQGQDRGPRREEAQQMRERYEARAQEPRFDQRAYEMQAREEQRRAMEMQQQERPREERRGARMTPDERRDLRRQIDEAGMDLYPNARRR